MCIAAMCDRPWTEAGPVEVYKVLDNNGTPPIVADHKKWNKKFGPGWNYATNRKRRRLTGTWQTSDYFGLRSHDNLSCGIHVYLRRNDAAHAAESCPGQRVVVKAIVDSGDIIAFDGQQVAALRIHISPEAWAIAGLSKKAMRYRNI